MKNNENDGLLVNLALVYEKLGETKKSEETHLKAIEKGFVGSMYMLAIFMKKMEKLKKLKNGIKRALENGVEPAREELEKFRGKQIR